MTSTRRRSSLEAATAARAGLIGLVGFVIAGIFATHVLSSHDHGGGHAMPVGLGSSAVTVGPMSGHAHSQPQATSQTVTASTAVAPGGSTPADFMTGCILFLTSVAGLILALLLAQVARTRITHTNISRWSWALHRRGPPGTGRPLASLCILQV